MVQLNYNIFIQPLYEAAVGQGEAAVHLAGQIQVVGVLKTNIVPSRWRRAWLRYYEPLLTECLSPSESYFKRRS